MGCHPNVGEMFTPKLCYAIIYKNIYLMSKPRCRWIVVLCLCTTQPVSQRLCYSLQSVHKQPAKAVSVNDNMLMLVSEALLQCVRVNTCAAKTLQSRLSHCFSALHTAC